MADSSLQKCCDQCAAEVQNLHYRAELKEVVSAMRKQVELSKLKQKEMSDRSLEF